MSKRNGAGSDLAVVRKSSEITIIDNALPGYAVELDFWTIQRLQSAAKDELGKERRRLCALAARLAVKIKAIEGVPNNVWNPRALRLAADTSKEAAIATVRIELGQALHMLQALDEIKT